MYKHVFLFENIEFTSSGAAVHGTDHVVIDGSFRDNKSIFTIF
jgi:hypothetical protein